jgi:GntR family transcriptional regulator, transcriptional repressor for pyruvate dehydrogenase complex
MSSLTAIPRATLGEQVAIQLAAMISDRHWKAGERLPPEPELCEALNVGRSTLREALKSLAFVGMVRIRAGDGTYVAEQSQGLLNRILARGLLKTEKDLEDVCETRILLETEIASLAATRATRKDLASLRNCLEQGRVSLETGSGQFTQIDLDFHLAVAQCSHNKLLPRLLFDIRELLVEWIQKSQQLPGLRENAQDQHKLIVEAIANRDAASARDQMRAHLETFERAYKLLGQISK